MELHISYWTTWVACVIFLVALYSLGYKNKLDNHRLTHPLLALTIVGLGASVAWALAHYVAGAAILFSTFLAGGVLGCLIGSYLNQTARSREMADLGHEIFGWSGIILFTVDLSGLIGLQIIALVAS